MKKLITYIFPIYNESGNIDLLHETIYKLQQQHPSYKYENIFINDGSKDDSLDKLIKLSTEYDNIRVINLSRNFGHQMAVTAGLDHARGDAIIVMDSDMQDPPKVSFDLIEKWQQGYDVVYAQRRSRQDSLFKRLTADFFYRMLQKIADVDIPRNTGDFRLLDKRVVEEMKKFKEHNRFLRGMTSYLGFKQIAVPFDRDSRNSGVTGYPLGRMIKFALDGIFGFSTAPLKLSAHIGYFFAAMSLLGIIYAFVVKLTAPAEVVPGWTFIVITIFFIGGVQLIILGVIGEYLARVFDETRNRPLYVIDKIYQ